MLHIILLILKVAGIILLVLLGIILLVSLTVTLVPLRYKGNGSYYEKPEGSVKITWLFHVFSILISYKEELSVTVRLFGIRVLKNRIEEPLAEAGDAAEWTKKRVAGKINEGIDYVDEPMVSVQEVKPPLEDPKTIRRDIGESSAKEDSQPDGDMKKTVFQRLWGKLTMIFHRLAALVKRMLGSFKKAENARQELLSFLTDEENKKTFHLMVRQAKKLMRHVFPNKLRGQVTFGFDDPYTTGQILTGAALFYPLYQSKFSVLPVFDRKTIEGEIAFRGHIRLGVFLMAGIKILLNRNFRTQLKKFMNRGGT